jgi:hypothetical protein
MEIGLFFSWRNDMRSVLRASVVLATVCGLALMASFATADVVGAANLFSGQTVAGDTAFNSTYALSNAVDGTTAASGFLDGATNYRMSISGFNSDIDRVRFFEAGFFQRTSPSVDLYYSSAVTSSLNVADYTFLGNFQIPNVYYENIDGAGSEGHRYLTPTDPPENGPGTQASPINWSELTGLGIPSGTRSVLFNFAPDNSSNLGVFFSEIQGYAVPEPSTIVVFGTALLGLVAYAWRKRR